MNPPLEAEILAALEQAGISPRSFVRISKLYSTSAERCSYRVEHEQGTVKVRRVEDERTARDLSAFRCELPDSFTAVIMRHGRVLIEEWIEGEKLPDPPRAEHLAAAAGLLAEMHAKPRLGDRTLHAVCSTESRYRLAQERLRTVAATGALKEGEVVRLERALERWNPLRATLGLTHLDFCGENMVIDRTGRLRVVDNDRVRVDALGYDLARTWYRWALPGSEWEAFCRAYCSRLPFPSSLDTLRFWKVAAAVQSAELRLRAYPEKVEVPLRYLRALAAEEAR